MYNFKCLFLLAYPHCIHFNIRDFKPCYVFVPKQKFRLYTTFQTPFYSILMSSLFIFFIKYIIFYTSMTQVYLFSDLCRVMMEQLFKKFQMYDFLPVLIVMYITKFKLSIANLIQVFFISIVNTYVHYRLIYYHFGRSFSSNFYLINTTSSLIDSLNC